MYPSIIAGAPLSVSDAAQAPPDYLATDRAYCILVRDPLPPQKKSINCSFLSLLQDAIPIVWVSF